MRREEAQFGRKPAASLVRCSCLHAREVSADVRLQGTKIVPGFTVAWLPPGQGQRGPPAELPGWWDRVVLSGQLPGSGCLRLLGNHVHELLAQDRRGNCREERALLGCPGLVPVLSQAQRFQVPSPHHVPQIPPSPRHKVQRAASRTRHPRQTKSFFHHVLDDSLNSGERSRWSWQK